MAWADKLEKIKEVLPWNRGDGKPVVVNEVGDAEPVSDESLLIPAVSVYEGEHEIIVHADVPGATAGSTRVHVQDTTVQLSARVATHESPHWRVCGREIEPGRWFRQFELPHYADGHRATSSLKHGVLTVRIPKRKTPRTHAIPVRAA